MKDFNRELGVLYFMKQGTNYIKLSDEWHLASTPYLDVLRHSCAVNCSILAGETMCYMCDKEIPANILAVFKLYILSNR